MRETKRSEAAVQTLLEACGFSVDHVERDGRTADFRVQDSTLAASYRHSFGPAGQL